MYRHFKAADGTPYGSFEVWEVDAKTARAESATYHGPGWYWWACFPGCLPDGDPFGPFDSESEAIANANEEGG